MADVTGPITTLPGSSRPADEAAMCDEHPDRPAVARIQGETDSFGSEMHDLCAECIAAIRAAGPNIGTCDWCKAPEVKLRPRRDMDEGTHGPVYDVCTDCVKRDEARISEEIAAYERDYFDED